MEAIRKIQWVGYAIAVLGSTLILVAIVFLLQPHRAEAGIAGFCLFFLGSTVKLVAALKEKRAKNSI
jgi:ABC-type uncharacterized transport system permease subunit